MDILLIVLSLLVVATFVMLCYVFNESRIELESPTIAAMEAHTEAVEARLKAEQPLAGTAEEEYEDAGPEEAPEDPIDQGEPPPLLKLADYEYREMLDEGGENYVLPQWIVNFFSSSDVCHTLDSDDSVVIIAKLNDARNAERGMVDISADSDMTTQTVTLKLCFGEGAAAETFRSKFYLFERGDLFELGRLVRQEEIRIDILTRGADYTLQYALTVRGKMPHGVPTQLKSVLSKIPA